MTDPKPETAQSLMSEVRAAARAGKYQKVRLIIAAAVERLPYAEALAFVRLVKINQGAQDLALLPNDAEWTIDYVSEGGVPHAVTTHAHTSYVRTLAGPYDFRISWPSVSHHWGVAVWFVSESGCRWCLRTSDYALTETYLSS